MSSRKYLATFHAIPVLQSCLRMHSPFEVTANIQQLRKATPRHIQSKLKQEGRVRMQCALDSACIPREAQRIKLLFASIKLRAFGMHQLEEAL